LVHVRTQTNHHRSPTDIPIFLQLRGLENGELQQTPPDFASGSSTISDEVPVSPSCFLIYQVEEQIFYLFVGSNNQESGLHRGQVENVILSGKGGNPVGWKEIAYLIARTGNGVYVWSGLTCLI
jgi:hypothetical protein